MNKSISLSTVLVLTCGVMAVSSSSLIIRGAQGLQAPALQIAAGRLLFASMILLPGLLIKQRGELHQFAANKLWSKPLLAGLFLALHFGCWIASLERLSVAESTALVATTPLWSALLQFLQARKLPQGRLLAGIGFTLAGAMLMLLVDNPAGSSYGSPFSHQLLALAGAAAMACYLQVSSSLSKRTSMTVMIGLNYSSAALWLSLACLLMGIAPLSGSGKVNGFILLLALGPQLIGHSSFNWALKRLSTVFVSLAILAEPLGAALLALIFLGESITQIQGVSFVLILVGILLSATAEKKQNKATQENTLVDSV